MKYALFLVLFFSDYLVAQNSDFIILKKKGKTSASWFAGRNIAFTTKSGAFINAYINEIKNDTLYLQEFIVQQSLTSFGTYFYDTVGSYHYKFHYNQLKAIGRESKRNFDWKGSGGVLLGGGTLLTIGSGIVYLADRKKFSAPLMLASAGLATIGYFLAKGKSNTMTIGGKYELIYMNMQNK